MSTASDESGSSGSDAWPRPADGARRRVLIIASGPVRELMAGTAVRYWTFAKELASQCEVILVTPNPDPPRPEGFVVVSHQRDRHFMHTLLQHADVVVVHGRVLQRFPELMRSATPVVVDVYDPFTLEALSINRERPFFNRVARNRVSLGLLAAQMARGDFFMCGNERQRDFWLGMLSAAGRLTPQNFDVDPTFRALIDVVPFGVPADEPTHTQPVLKGVIPGIHADDHVLMWAGGVWDWFDALTPIRAVQQLSRRRNDVKLVFLGVRSPDPTVAIDREARAARRLSDEVGLTNHHVFFAEWVGRGGMANHLLEADLGVYAHPATLETRLSIRSRVFDYIWARLPMVIAAGDVMGERMRDAGVAWTFPVGDAAAMAQAVEAALAVPDLRARTKPAFDALREEFSVERAMRPLREFCRAPHIAADRRNRCTQAVVAAKTYELVSRFSWVERIVDAYLERRHEPALPG